MSFLLQNVLHIDGMLPRGRYSSNEWDWEIIDNKVPNELLADSRRPLRFFRKDSHEGEK